MIQFGVIIIHIPITMHTMNGLTKKGSLFAVPTNGFTKETKFLLLKSQAENLAYLLTHCQKSLRI